MNEVKHIHLGRQQFTVSLEAYGELKAYLDDITTQTKDDTGVAEEVELRMAELLTERGCSEEKVVLPKDVKFLKEQLGEPKDFRDVEADEPDPDDSKASDAPRRLFRDTQNGMIAGVAAGLAKYFGIDAVVVRIIFVVLTFAGASGVLIYLLLWLLVPEARTASERLSMQGKSATVENLKQAVKRADVPGAAQRGSTHAARLLRTLGGVLLFIIGLPLAIGTGVALLWTLLISIYFLLHGARVGGQVVAPIGGHEVTAFIAVAVAVITLLLAMLLIGIAMIRRRWQMPAWGVAALIGVFFIAASIGGAFAADVVPRVRDRVNALHHSRTVSLPAFTTASFKGHDTRFIFVPDSRYYIKYRYFGALDFRQVQTTVKDDALTVQTDSVKDNVDCSIFCVYSGPDLQVEIHAPQLSQVQVRGDQANFLSSNALKQPGMALTIAGNSLATLTNVYPKAALLHDNNTGDRTLAMTFDANAQPQDGVTLDGEYDQGTVSFYRVGELNLENDRPCDEGDPYVFVISDIQALKLNGKVVPSSDGYDSLRSSDQNNLYNCVVLRDFAPLSPTDPAMPPVKIYNR